MASRVSARDYPVLDSVAIILDARVLQHAMKYSAEVLVQCVAVNKHVQDDRR